MATPTISISLLEHFSPILLFILVFALLYGIFQWAKILGENKALHSIIAFLVAIFVTVFSQGARDMIEFIIPWFTMLAILIVFSIMLYKIFGVSDSDMRKVIARPQMYWTLFIIIIIIVLGALSHAFGQTQLQITTNTSGTSTQGSSSTGIINAGNPGTSDTTSGSFNQNLGATFYNPKIIGTLFLLLVGALAVAFLSRPVTRT